MIKDFIIGKVLTIAGSKLDGYKTKIGGAGLILTGIGTVIVAITMALRLMFPDLTSFPEADVTTMLKTGGAGIASISIGFSTIGLGHKVDKNTVAVKAQVKTVDQEIDEYVKKDDPTGISSVN